MSNQSHTIQLIGGDGVFNYLFNGFMNDLMKKVNFNEDGRLYGVVSIIGPQSSGKSTLLNHLFQTSFQEMNASKGRSQTTKGIWLATCADIDPFTLVVDVEGTDGKERGKDDTTFEKQSALFALAVSDIIIINMWCHEIGREHAANKPLMRTVFQVMMRLFKPRKTVLLFVIRDKTETPLELLEQELRASIHEIWDSVKQDCNDTQLDNFFSMKVVALPHYRYENGDFKKQVQHLKERFSCLFALEGLVRNRPEVVPIRGFARSVEQMWESIKANKDLDLPEHAKMVATFRCEEICQEKLFHLLADKDWCMLKSDAKLGPVDGFGEKLRGILNIYLLRYDEEAAYFDKGVSSAKRQQLECTALSDAYPAYQEVIRHLSCRNLNKFKDYFDRVLQGGVRFAVAAEICLSQCLSEFDKGCADAYVETASWDTSEVREMLRRDSYKHMLDQLAAQYEKQLSAALEEPLGSLFHDGGNDTWPKIRELLGRETAAKREYLSCDLSDLKIDTETTGKILGSLAAFGRSVVGERARGEARNVVSRMKDKFFRSFYRRNWTEQDDIKTIAQAALSGCLELLSVMAAIRLDDKPDNMENTLSITLTDDGHIKFTNGNLMSSVDLPDSSTWEGIPADNVLIAPMDCNSLLTKLKGEILPFLEQAYSMQINAAKLSAAEAKVAEAAKVASAEAKAAEQAQLASEAKAREANAAEQVRMAAEVHAAELERLAEDLARLAEQVKAADQARLAAEATAIVAEAKSKVAAAEAKAEVAAAEAKSAEQALLAAEAKATVRALEAKAEVAAAEAKAAEQERLAAEAKARVRALEAKAAEKERLGILGRTKLEAQEKAKKVAQKLLGGLTKTFLLRHRSSRPLPQRR